MKKLGLAVLGVFCGMAMQAQPRPFEPDPSFVPSLAFMQKSWSGDYDGLEPNSRMILSISRTMLLNEDMSYTNEVKGQIKNQSEKVVLRYEKGTYQYDEENRSVIYSIEMDSTLDINSLLQGEELSYVVNHYLEDGAVKNSTEEVQFTRASSDDARQWILFDQQLASPVDPRQKAVYVLTGKQIEDAMIAAPSFADTTGGGKCFYLNGTMFVGRSSGVYVAGGKKYMMKAK